MDKDERLVKALESIAESLSDIAYEMESSNGYIGGIQHELEGWKYNSGYLLDALDDQRKLLEDLKIIEGAKAIKEVSGKVPNHLRIGLGRMFDDYIFF